MIRYRAGSVLRTFVWALIAIYLFLGVIALFLLNQWGPHDD